MIAGTRLPFAAFKGSAGELTWRPLAWFMPDTGPIMVLHRGAGAGRVPLSKLMAG